jgi:hypothetical protein
MDLLLMAALAVVVAAEYITTVLDSQAMLDTVVAVVLV